MDGLTATGGEAFAGAATGGATGEAGVTCLTIGFSTVDIGGGGETTTCLTAGFFVACGSGGSTVEEAGTGLVLTSVKLGDSELASLNGMPMGLDRLKANPNTTLAASNPTNCPSIRRVREAGREASGDDD
ncbi:MAG TPA: hypothetical protein VFZ59_10205 [Verrucomicrobiae bacterium]|nr:hypothetical protein [Verrucomicrobiae bacterium]